MNKLFRKALMFISLFIALGVMTIMVLSYRSEQSIPAKTEDEITAGLLQNLNLKAWQQTDTIHFTSPQGWHYHWYKTNQTLRIEMDSSYILLYTEIKSPDDLMASSRPFTAEEVDQIRKQWHADRFRLFGYLISFEASTTKAFIPSKGNIQMKLTLADDAIHNGYVQHWTLSDTFMPISCVLRSADNTKVHHISWDRWITLPSGLKLAECYSEDGLRQCFTQIHTTP
ncbi:MAG: hypothetical protein IPN29_05165 [Saprospiraceae bacterium]|nr:hypothetical protein [Saprospiraceae bacterium]